MGKVTSKVNCLGGSDVEAWGLCRMMDAVVVSTSTVLRPEWGLRGAASLSHDRGRRTRCSPLASPCCSEVECELPRAPLRCERGRRLLATRAPRTGRCMRSATHSPLEAMPASANCRCGARQGMHNLKPGQPRDEMQTRQHARAAPWSPSRCLFVLHDIPVLGRSRIASLPQAWPWR